MNDERSPVRVQFTDDFQKQIRFLAKKYRQIRVDIQPVIEQLEDGDLIGDQITRIGCTVFKVRAKNSDIQKGKSAGYRLIYQLISPVDILLLLIYSKSEQSDVTAEEIQDAIAGFNESKPS